MHLVMGLNKNDGNTRGYSYAALATGEGLLIFVGMGQDTFAQHLAGAIDNAPGIGIMIPSRITMTQSGADVPRTALTGELGIHYLSVIRGNGHQRRHDGNQQNMSEIHLIFSP